MKINFNNNQTVLMKNVQNNFSRANKTMEQLSTGKKFNSINEGFVEQIVANNTLNSKQSNLHLLKGINEGKKIIDHGYSILSEIKNLLTEQKRIADTISSGTFITDSTIVEKEFENIGERLKELCKTEYAGKKIFDGKNNKSESSDVKSKLNNLKLAKEALAAENAKGSGKVLATIATLEGDVTTAQNALKDFPLTIKTGLSKTEKLDLTIEQMDELNIYRNTAAAAGGPSTAITGPEAPKVDDKANAGLALTRITNGIAYVEAQLATFLSLKDSLTFNEKQITDQISTLDQQYSEIMDIDVAESSNQLIKDMLKVNTATMAQVHENNMIKEMILTLINNSK